MTELCELIVITAVLRDSEVAVPGLPIILKLPPNKLMARCVKRLLTFVVVLSSSIVEFGLIVNPGVTPAPETTSLPELTIVPVKVFAAVNVTVLPPTLER